MRKPLKIQGRFRHPEAFKRVSGKAVDYERLASCAIIRDGQIHHGQRSHAQLRSGLGDTDAYEQKYRPDDTEGFMTSKGRFVDREEGRLIGVRVGQVPSGLGRVLLSSDVRW